MLNYLCHTHWHEDSVDVLVSAWHMLCQVDKVILSWNRTEDKFHRVLEFALNVSNGSKSKPKERERKVHHLGSTYFHLMLRTEGKQHKTNCSQLGRRTVRIHCFIYFILLYCILFHFILFIYSILFYLFSYFWILTSCETM